MPAASTSRRQLRREESDMIEEGATQHVARRDDIEEDDDEALAIPRGGRLKKGKGKKSSRRDADEDEEEDEPEDPADANIDDIKQSLADQPLVKEQHHRIQGMSSDWNQVRTASHEVWYGVVKDVGALTAEFAEGENGEDLLKDIDATMKSLLDAEHELLVHEQALQALQQKVARGENVTDPVEEYEAKLNDMRNEYKAKTTRQKYAKSDKYSNFRQGIFEIQTPDEPMPPITDFIPKEDGDNSDDDDIEVGGLVQDYRCPLTLITLKDPLTSKRCRHSFSKDAILSHLGGKPKACPTTGCKNIIYPNELFEDKELKKKVENMLRRERMREDEVDDVDDVVE